MRRRQFIALLGFGLTAGLPHRAKAQSSKVYRVGLALTTSPLSEMAGPDPIAPPARAFVHGLRDLGYVEGQNLILERRSAEGHLCYLDGSYIPFAKTKAARDANHDNRLSIEERYRDKADYVGEITRSAEALEKTGYILAEDRKRIIERAAALTW